MMATPWFDPNTFGALYGGIGGGVLGSLAGLLGAAAGTLAPRGKGRRWILGGMAAMIGLGVLSLGFGVAAIVAGQPWGIWYPALLLGGVLTVVIGSLVPVIRARYAEAEARRMEAESLRGT